MDTIKEIDVKSVMTKSSLPVGGYSVNPYVGCPHACRYCYASFMKRFTGHTEPWGTFLDVKNWKPITNPHKYDGERVVIGSVTDGYNPYEEEFHRTRRLLEELRGSDAEIMICTKSDLVLRDLDLLKSFPKVTVSWSVNTLDEQFCADMDNAVSIERRLKAMRQTYEAGIRTVCFVSPIFPRITDVKAIIEEVKDYADLIWLENLNLEAMIADVMDYKFLSNVEKLPKRRIGDIALIKAGGDCPQEWSKYKTKDYQIPIYSNGTDNEGLYGYTKEPVILKRSVTVAARGTIGYCEIREGGYVPIIRLLAVTPNDIGGDVYLHQVFNRIKFKNDGSIQQQLTVPSIASIEIPYPDASALKTFANITYPFIEKIKLNKIQIEELTKQRDKLLPLLMNGQVSVNSDLSLG